MEDVTQAREQSQEYPHNRSKSTGRSSSQYMLHSASEDDVEGGAPTSASVYLDAPGPSHLQGYYHSPAHSQQHFEPQMDSYTARTLYPQQQPYTTVDASTSTYPPSTSMLSSTSMMSNMSSPMIPHSIDGPLQDPHAGPVMMARSNHGNSLDAHAYYQQQTFATQGGSFTNQGAYYPPSTSASAIHGGVYPHMMGGISPPHYSTNPYGVQQHQQYTYNAYNSLPLHPYNAQVHQIAGWTSSPMLDASHSQQQAWMQQQKYDPYQRQHHQQQNLMQPWSNNNNARLYTQTSLASSPSGRLSSTRQSSSRTSTATNSSLPARPGGGLAPPGRSAQSPSSAASAAAETGRVAQSQPDQDEQIPGKGLRQHYHPQQGPRSDFVLWCGNVPSDATVEELWSFFSTLPPQTGDSSSVSSAESRQHKRLMQEAEELPGDPAMSPTSGHGVLSVFIIARSNCAFINYATPEHLERGVSFFHGQSLRPQDPRCPKLVCRVRKKDDEAQAGVAGQRGRGMHVAWVKEQDRKTKELARSRSKTSEEAVPRGLPLAGGEGVVRDLTKLAGNESGIDEATLLMAASDPSSDSALASSSLTTDVTQAASGDDEKGKRPSISAGDGSSGSISYTSTNSSLLRHPAFHERFFILKSLRLDDLDRSAETGLWATQPHNESVLDQAFRNSESVYLIFSANESGGFYGYARMAGPILSTQEKQQQQQKGRTNLQNAARPLSPGSAILQRSDTIRPEMIEEMKEEVVDSTAPFATSETGQSQTKSPMQLTPAGEIESPMANLAPYESLSWPVQSAKGGEEQERDDKRLMQSLSYDAGPRRTTVEDPKAVVTSAPPSDTSKPNRVREKTSMSKENSSSSLLQASLSEAGSLGPSDSASFDSRAQQHLALRALIHNLRLEERESMMRAEQLERNMGVPLADQQGTVPPVVGTADSTETSTPRAGSSDSFGKPFRVEWIERSPLPFQQVRKLRNPWRDNRQVKVSRDGTELEPNVGRQLLKEWSQTVAMTRGPLKEEKADFREADLEEEG